MTKLAVLLKANLINTFNLNKLRNKSGKVSIWKIILMILLVLLIFASAFFYMLVFGSIFAEQGQAGTILFLGVAAGSVFSLISTIVNANSYLFKNKDYELLISLPIKIRTVFLSKITNLLLVNYLPFIIIYLPSVIVYAIFVETSLVFWLMTIPVFLLTPIPAITIASLISYLIGRVTVRIKHKNIISIVLSVVFLVLIVVLSMQSSAMEENPGEFTRVVGNILNWFKIENFAYLALTGDLINLLFLLLVSIIPFYLFVLIIGKNYQLINSRNYYTHINKDFKLTDQKRNSQKSALIKREVKRYFSSPAYVMNTLVGPLLSTVMIVLFRVSLKEISLEFPDMTNIFGEMSFIIIALSIFTLGINSTTSASISLEGNKFWIIKSAPVSPKQIFHAKIFVNLLITIPFVIINLVLVQFFFTFTIVDSLFLLVIPTLFSIMMSYAGLFANLLLPRFNYDSDVKAVKQSVSVLVTILIGFASSAMVLIPGFIINYGGGNIFLAYFVETIVVSVIMVLFITLVNTYGVKRFHRLVA